MFCATVARVAEAFLGARERRDAEARRDLLVPLPVAVPAPRTELVRRRRPPEGAAVAELAVELARLHAECAVVVRNHGGVPESRQRFAGDIDTGTKIRPEELVGHDAVVAQPVRMRPVQRPRSRVAGQSRVHAELLAELVAEVGEDRVLVRCVHRPERDVVDELLAAHPALQEHHDPVREDVVARVDHAFVAEMVPEDAVGIVLVHVARHRVGADVEFTEAAASDDEAGARVVNAPGFDGGRERRLVRYLAQSLERHRARAAGRRCGWSDNGCGRVLIGGGPCDDCWG